MKYFRHLVGIAIIIGFIVWIGPGKIILALSEISLLSILLLIILQIISQIISALALSFLLPYIPQGYYSLFSRASLISTIAPKGAEEATLGFLLVKAGIPLAETTRAIFLDRIATVFSILASLIALPLIFNLISISFAIVLWCILILSGIILLYVFRKKNSGIVKNAILTGIRVLLWGITYLFLFRTVGTKSGAFFDFTVIPIAMQILSIIPIPGGLGVTEFSAIFLFNKLGISPDITLTAYLIARVTSMIGTTIVAFAPRGRRNKLYE